MQSGVRREPAPPPKRDKKLSMFRVPSCNPWSEVESGDEDERAGSSSGAVAIPAADSVEYARL
eukprot:7671487-Heterocapsa_arctica.AAC.1